MYFDIATSHLVPSCLITAMERLTGQITAESMSETPCSSLATWFLYQSSNFRLRKSLAGLFTSTSSGCKTFVLFGGRRQTCTVCCVHQDGSWLRELSVPWSYPLLLRLKQTGFVINHCFLSRLVSWGMGDVPPTRKRTTRVATRWFVLVNHLQGQNITDRCTTKDHSVLPVVSLTPVTSTRLELNWSIVQLDAGTKLIPIWSQLRISSGRTSSISTTATTSLRNAFWDDQCLQENTSFLT